MANLASTFASVFDAAGWAHLTGLWHDIGKYSSEFQQRLLAASDDEGIEVPGHVDHSTAGAQHAASRLKDKGKLLAYAIAGHHAGLPDGKTADASCLFARLSKKISDYSACPQHILSQDLPDSLPFVSDKKRFSFQLSFFTRMLFSCLVDADFLDTETFIEPDKADWRKGYPSLEELHGKLMAHLSLKTSRSPQTSVNSHRGSVLKQCLAAAEHSPGIFSLTVPTGGGKTLSSLAFGLKHALKHGFQRIIYVIPYTTIIEQNAAVLRDILGDNAVLEHHSNYEPKQDDYRSRLAAENWDASLVVTTNVQFFESLFSARPSRCRKLHSIAGSVVILDEAQMLPPQLLRPCMEALRELASTYRTSIVLCTATQPALSTTKNFPDGIDNVKEIIQDPEGLYQSLKRVGVAKLGRLSDDELANQLMNHEVVLCVVSTRKHARALYERLQPKGDCYHLSALMCPVHRSEVLKRIRADLSASKPCRVVSTQLIEAGVDIDFPVVFRSLAGIDSIAQAAGRCNREGKLERHGQVYTFTPEYTLPPGYFKQAAEAAEMVMRHNDDPLSLDAIREYFQLLYWLKSEKLDEYQILSDIAEGATRGDFPFRGIASKFKLIEDSMESLVIPWNAEAESIISALRTSEHPGIYTRKAQRYTIQVPPRVINALEKAGDVECINGQFRILVNITLYRDDLGLCPEKKTFQKAESLSSNK